MRLTRQTNYAVRILMYLAVEETKLCQIPEIARSYGVSEAFMFKILPFLGKAGLIETVRGRNGGICLARPAVEITLLDVVRATEETFAMAECFEDDTAECPLISHCELNAALREALGAFFSVLETYSIADLVYSRKKIANLLGMQIN